MLLDTEDVTVVSAGARAPGTFVCHRSNVIFRHVILFNFFFVLMSFIVWLVVFTFDFDLKLWV